MMLSYPLPALPQIPQILDPVDDAASVTIEALQNYDGSLQSLENEDQSDRNKKTQRTSLKYKGQGVIANFRVYLKPDSPVDVIQQHRAEDYNMMGVIIEVPNQKNGMYYEIRWNSAVCPLSLDELNVRTLFFKDDVTVDFMKKARVEYEKNYPSPPTFHLAKKTKRHIHQRRRRRRSLTSPQMKRNHQRSAKTKRRTINERMCA